jgi:hypothetical protein
VVLRTLTLHLPTNLPPPLHSEVIYGLFSRSRKSYLSMVHLPNKPFHWRRAIWGECGWPTGVSICARASIRNQEQAASGIDRRGTKNPCLFLCRLQRFACSIACYLFPCRRSVSDKATGGAMALRWRYPGVTEVRAEIPINSNEICRMTSLLSVIHSGAQRCSQLFSKEKR